MSTLAAEDDEPLEDGTGATTPDGDNLLLDFARTEARAYADLLAPLGAQVKAHDSLGLHVIDAHSPSPFGNMAMLDRPVPDSRLPSLGGALDESFRGSEGGPYLLFSPWPIGDLSAWGLTPVGHPPLMFRPTGHTPATAATRTTAEVTAATTQATASEVTAATPPVTVSTVTDEAGLRGFERTLVEAFPVGELQPWAPGCFLHRVIVDDPRWHLFTGVDGASTIATAAAYAGDGLTVVEMVSTRPEARGRGIGAAMTAAAAGVAPDQPAALIASDDGRGVYQSLGFFTLLRYSLWIGTRPSR